MSTDPQSFLFEVAAKKQERIDVLLSENRMLQARAERAEADLARARELLEKEAEYTAIHQSTSLGYATTLALLKPVVDAAEALGEQWLVTRESPNCSLDQMVSTLDALARSVSPDRTEETP